MTRASASPSSGRRSASPGSWPTAPPSRSASGSRCASRVTDGKVHLAAFGVTEPDAGSDVSSLRSRAVYDEATDEWVLNGTKTFITNGGIADVHVLCCRSTPRSVREGRRASSSRPARLG